MKLKKIILHGFKSFADRTSLEFSDGITAIVGPNGCGKSNVVDAFRWVMGEQSAKSMRGQKMPDVIFAGAGQRKQLNFAEITLVLTDVGGKLPIDFDEVAVTRRLHRSGESEYLLNRHNVRLKDIRSIFLDSGIGSHSFSIFEQGKIDQVINLNANDRRFIFEEAAGILRFLQRKREALRKLEETDANMLRAGDIFLEVEKQIQVLERQAEAARIYKENKAQLAALEKAVAKARIEELFSKEKSLSCVVEEHGRGLELLQGLELTLQAQLFDYKAKLEAVELEFRQASENVYKTRSDYEIRMKEREGKKERFEEANERAAKLRSNLQEVKHKRKLSQDLHGKNKKRFAELEKHYKTGLREVEGSRNFLSQLEGQVKTERERLESTQAKRLQAVKEELEAKGGLKQAALRKETLLEKQEDLSSQEQKSRELARRLEKTMQERTSNLEKINAGVERCRTGLDGCVDRMEELRVRRQESETTLEQSVRQFTKSKARYEAIKSLQEDLEGSSSSAKKLLKESQKAKSPLYGCLQGIWELMEVPKESRPAIEFYAQTLVVKKDLAKVLDYVQSQGMTDLSLFSPKAPGWERAFLPGFQVDLEKALDKGEVFFVHKDGVYVDEKGVLFIGFGTKGNSFSRQEEMGRLAQEMDSLKVSSLQQEKTIDGICQELAHVEKERERLDRDLRRHEMKQVESNFLLQQVKSDWKKADYSQKRASQEAAGLEGAIGKLEGQIQELEAKESILGQKVQNAAESIEELQESIQERQQALQEAREDNNSHESSFQTTSDEYKKIAHMLEIFQERDQEAAEQEKRLMDDLEELSDFQTRFKSEEKNVSTSIQEVKCSLKKVETTSKTKERQVQGWKKKIATVDKNILQVAKEIKREEKEKNGRSLQLAEVKSRFGQIAKDLKERQNMDVEALLALEAPLELSLDESEKRLKALRKAVDNAGDVNMTSIEEFDKHRVRYDFLKEQIGDLEGSKSELCQIIQQLDTESRKLFKETFDKIRENFKRNFQILFNGGEADLSFLGDGDVLEAGIDIVAKPPGKKMRSIQLLSGGEKCLTAMALLFGIFEVKPAPFCILDEIDAPLDDSNIARFVNVVKQFIDRCQFIIITHNKRTMAIADRLFGVSMQEKGVSKLLEMNFVHKESREEVEIFA